MADDLNGEFDLEAYRNRLFSVVLDAVISVDSGADAPAGVIEPHTIREALADVAATIDYSCGLGRVPSERRKMGEEMSKRYAGLLKSLIENGHTIDWPMAQRIPDPDKHN